MTANRCPTICCDGCGLCCLNVSSPPMFAAFFPRPGQERAAWTRGTPEERLIQSMPKSLRVKLLSYYMRCVRTGDWRDREPCCWFDLVAKRCRHYEFRPSICREFELGGEDCLRIRKQSVMRPAGAPQKGTP